jgi:hypothetical protein
MVLILPTLMEPKAAKHTPMTVRVPLMVPTVEQLLGVMVAALLIAPMAARLIGVMVPVLQKVHVAVQRVGVMVPARQHQLEDNPEAGVDKRLTVEFYRFFLIPTFQLKPG